MSLRKLALLFFFFPLVAFAQGPATTTVQGPVYGLDGGLANGTVRVVSPLAFKSTDGFYIAQNTQYLAQIANGAMTISLVPNTYDQAGNLLDFYTATYQLTTGTYVEYWIIPSSGSPISIPAVVSPVLPVPGIQVNVYQLVPPVNCQSLGGFPKFVGFWTCSTGGGALVQTNGTQNTSQLTLNFQNPTAFQGLSFAFSNPSGGIETFSVSGTLNNAGLTNSSTTINSQACSLGATCTIPFQTNGSGNTSQAGINFTNPSSFNGLTFTFTNPTTNSESFSIGGTLNNTGLTNSSTTVNGQVCALGSSCSIATGSPPGSPAFSLQMANSGVTGFIASNIIQQSNGTEFINSDTIHLGPNPFVDVRAFGARAVNPNFTPAVVGITATINSGSASATVSTSSCASQTGNVCFVNGDGVVVYGAGATQSMPTPGAPTVTPSIARNLTGLRDVVAGPSGSTTYNYQVFAEDVGGGLTAVSSVGSTTTGAASLGQQSVSITSCTRSNDTVTCTTSSPHGLNINNSAQLVFIQNTLDPSFSNWWQTSNVPDSTHFSYVSTLDTRNNATTSTTGGTVYWWNCNHVAWSAVTGAYRYWIAGRTGGSLTTIGVSWPTNALNGGITEGVLAWDDYGSPMMSNLLLPGYIPSTPPSVATSDHLVTTVVSGAGTTTLTLAANAGTSVTTAGILLDTTPAINAAVAAAVANGFGFPVRISSVTGGNYYPINSLLDLSGKQNISLEVAGPLALRNTIKVANWSKISGITPGTTNNKSSFSFESLPSILDYNAYPGIHLVGGTGDVIEGVAFVAATPSGGGNNHILVLQDFGSANPGTTYNRVEFNTGTQPSGDYMGMGLLNRGINGSLAGEFRFTQVHALGGGTGGSALWSPTPLIACMECGKVQIGALQISGRGTYIGMDQSGGSSIDLGWGYVQGGTNPFFTMAGGSSNPGIIRYGPTTFDTFFGPNLTLLTNATGSPFVYVKDDSTGGGVSGLLPYTGAKPFHVFTGARSTSTFFNLYPNRDFTGFSHDYATDGIYATNTEARMSLFYNDAYVGVGPTYGMFIDAPVMAAPGLALASGGLVPTSAQSYTIAPIWQNGGVSSVSTSVSITPTTGNQTVNLTWIPVAGACKGYAIFRNGAQLLSTVQTVAGCSSNSYSDTASAPFGNTTPQIPAGGPTMLMPGVQGIATPAMILAGSQSLTGVQGLDTNILTSGTATGNAGFTLCKDSNGGASTIGCSLTPLGPNPYVDITAYGARAVVSNSTPAVAGITAITNATTTVTVSTSSCAGQAGNVCFVNGDGVTIYNVGPGITMTTPSAPTVTPSNAAFGTGTGIVVNAPTGATTFNYKVLACDINGGCTAASTAGSTTTGNALGAQSLSVTSITRANDVLTFNTPSQPNFSVGTHVHVDGCSVADGNAGFCGYFNVSTVTAGGFTVAGTGLDTRNGAAAASAGGATVNWFACNHVTWSAVTGTFRYVVQSDRQNPGTFVNIGMSWPTDGLFIDGTTFFDDFGQTMMARSASAIPGYVPTNGSATNDNLTTTIVSGAGTTTLVLANAATQSLSGQTILFDDTPAIIAANNSIAGGAVEFSIPASGTTYVTNSILNISSNQYNQWMFPAGAAFKDTVVWNTNASFGIQWYGDRLPGGGSAASFQPKSVPQIFFGTSPGLFVANGGGGAGEVRSLQFAGAPNGIAVMVDGGGGNVGGSWDQVNFLGAQTSTDYMSMGFVCRGVSGSSSCVARFGTLLVAAGTQAMSDTSFTPSMWLDDFGDITMNILAGSGRSIYVKADPAGSQFRVGSYHWQGGAGPLVSVNSPGIGVGIILGDAGGSIIDTGPNAAVFNGGINPHPVFVTCGVNGCGSPIAGVLPFTGSSMFVSGSANGATNGQNRNSQSPRFGQINDGIFSAFSNPPQNYLENYFSGAVAVGPSYKFFVDIPAMAAPAAAVVSGGSVPIGTQLYSIAPVWQDNSIGNVSATVSALTSTGNQQVNLTWTPTTGCKGYLIYRNAIGLSGNAVTVSGCSTSAYSDTAALPSGSGAPTFAGGGPTMLMPGTQGIATPALILAGSQSLTGVQGTDTNVLTSGIMTGSTGSTVCKDANAGVTTSGCSAPVGGTVTYTANQTASTSDNGKLVLMNCSAACTYTLPATQPSTAWFADVMTIGSTTAAVALGGSDTFNNSTSVPVLIKWQILSVYANTAISTDYEGSAPLLAGSGISFTATSNSLTITGTGGGGGVTLQTNGTNNASQSALNFVNPASFNGLTFTFSNPTSGNETFALGGTLGNAGLTNSSVTINGVAIALGGSATVSGTESTQTANYTATSVDFQLSRRIIMNCSSACTLTLPGTVPPNGEIGVESIGSAVASVSLNGHNFNGASAVPVLISDAMYVWTTDGTNYFGGAPEVAGAGIAFTPASNGVTIATANIPNSSLQNSSTTVNSQTCTLGAACTIPEQVNGTNLTSQAGFNDITSTVNSIGLTITPSNPGTNQIKNEVTGTLNPGGGGCGLANPTAHSLFIAEGSSNCSLLTSPSTNGFYVVGFNVTAGVATDPVAALQGVPVNAQSGNYSLLYSDRASYIKESGTTTSTLTLPQITGNTASSFPFVTQNLNSGNETLAANAVDKIDGSATGGSQTVPPNFAAFVYQDQSAAPGNWWTVRFPTLAAFPSCSSSSNALTWNTSTLQFGCNSISGGGGGGFPSITGTASNVTNQSASQSAVTIGTSPTAGQYEIQYYVDLNTACTSGSNAVNFSFNWTDASGTGRSLQTGNLSMGTSQASSSYLSGAFFIWVGSGNVTYTSTVVGACSSGTSSYDIHIPGLMRVQ